ncbi:valine--tRNA ligase, mitochondrial 1-like isoform X1 [Salvia splendens]|uniref:valine--tRNA ligase, mitochondrial 1-like isoform X1 n=1 Tax=Salvia splendens TaxID=180675 RepID=UPI001C27170B|nr:valine--tRNA ligase, mitochondrial 1-like isoform X1 [Salvia splendens]
MLKPQQHCRSGYLTTMDPRDLSDPTVVELDRKLKKLGKAREKELKKLKAAQKAAASKHQKQQPSKSKMEKNAKKEAEKVNPLEVDPETPLGEKKKLSHQMPQNYHSSTVEKSWYEWWDKSKFFQADSKSSKPPFVIVLPPPNVTGALHIGHALTASLQDAIIRWKRMAGFNALWVPGMDHAGIATQVVVEKKLKAEQELERHDLGRERFVDEVWKWKNEYGGTILKQLRRLGASLDWSRECFTLDEKRSRAVTESFIRLHKEGLIYRDKRLVAWDCRMQTTISKVELKDEYIKERTLRPVHGYETEVEFGVLTSFAYPLEGDLGEIVVATTRVETMLGDTAVAIHPHDPRYKHLHGKFAVHPFNGRKLKIICDSFLVDMKFGTGAVKITPAHDPDDYEVGKRHDLDCITIFTDDGKINSNGGEEFEGMPRFKARVAVIQALKEKGLHRGDKDNEMCLKICSTSNEVVEYLVKPQWFVSCKGMAEDGLNAVIGCTNPKLGILPKQYVAEWQRWLEHIRDWCISRQIWWGHRIPAWYVELEDDQLKGLGAYDDRWVVCRTEEEAQEEASRLFAGKKFQLIQDPDVLDTWFSSALFPLSAFGWPDETEDLKAFYPTSLLETGHDILFFWVARMVMMCMKLGGDLPFTKVYLHPMVRDSHGYKMSKTLGNGIDPLDIINGATLEELHEKLDIRFKQGNLTEDEVKTAKERQNKDFPDGIKECGTDALRFALISYTAQSDKINLDIQRVEGYREWCNKLWNATRFAMTKLGDDYTPPIEIDPASIPFSCKWILSVLNKAISKTVASLESFEFSDAATAVYSWWKYQLCDIFVEVIKPYFAGNDPAFASARRSAQDTLWLCLDYGLRLLHPFMPFITEDLWQRLPSRIDSVRKESIVISEYPSVVKSWTNDDVESEMDMINSVIKSLRSLKSQLPPKVRPAAIVHCHTNYAHGIIKGHDMEIVTLAKLSSLTVLSEDDDVPVGYLVELVNESLSVFLEQGSIKFEAELGKLKKMEEMHKQR